VRKSWNKSELARISADLDRELASTLDRLELGHTRPTDQEADDRPAEAPWAENQEPAWSGETGEPEPGPRPVSGPAARLAGKHFLSEDLNIDATPKPEPQLPGMAMAEDDWLEPELLGEPEVSVRLSPEAVRELSRIIEAAVEKGVAAALAKLKDSRRPDNGPKE